MSKTFGFVIVSNQKMLICHPTGSGHWTLPKGAREEGEQHLDAAKREVLEETGLNLDLLKGEIEYLGEFPYPHNRKTLYAWIFRAEDDLCNMKLKCDSLIDNPKDVNYGLPEIDSHLWVNFDKAIKMLHKAGADAVVKILGK